MSYAQMPLKRLLSRNDGGVWGDDPDGLGDVIVLRSTEQTVDGHWTIDDPAPRKLSPTDAVRYRLHRGDLLVTKSSGSPSHIGKATLVTHEVASMRPCYSNFMQRLRISATNNAKFYWYVLRTKETREQMGFYSTTSTGLANLNATILGELRVPRPPLQTQIRVVEFLDHETAQIDALIGKQERLIELLFEKRQAIITHAVTKGLDPTAPTKPSGIPWLGDLPRHWTTSRLKWTRPSQESGTSVNGTDVPAGSDEFGVLKTGAVSKGYFVPEANKTVVPEDMDRVTCPVRGGTLIVNRANTPDLVGSTGRTTVDLPTLFLSDKLWQVDFERADTNFIFWWSKTDVYRSQIQFRRVGASSSMQNLSYPDFLTVDLALPAPEEQQIIAKYIDDRTASIDVLMDKARKAVVLLRERRSALISAAVTGKIDVREGVA